MIESPILDEAYALMRQMAKREAVDRVSQATEQSKRETTWNSVIRVLAERFGNVSDVVKTALTKSS